MVHFNRLPNGALPDDNLINFRLSQLDSAIVQGELFGPASIRTISSGEVVINGGYQIIAAETGTTDDLETITVADGAVTPNLIVLQADTGDTIAVQHGSGNIKTRTGVAVNLDGTETLMMFWDGTQYNYIAGGRTGDVSVRAYESTAQSIPDDTETLVTFTATEFFDTASMHDTATNPGRITITQAGKYDIDAHIKYLPNATGYRELSIKLNGTTTIALARENNSGASAAHSMHVSTIYSLAVDDYLEAYTRQLRGAALQIAVLGNSSNVFLAKLLAG
jgi:hypothetical protein